MGEYVQIGDVKTWYAVDGPPEAEPLVLLHGGMSEGSAWGANAPAMASRYRTYIPDRRGHGKTPDVDGPLTYDAMTGASPTGAQPYTTWAPVGPLSSV